MQGREKPQFRYRDRLMNEFIERRAKNQGYSLRAFARDLRLSAATLSQVLSGKRDLAKASARVVADRLAFSPEQTRKMLSEIRGEPQTDSVDWSEHELIQEDVFRLMSDWYYFAILNLARVPDNRAEPEWIADRLGLSMPEVLGAIKRLKRLGLLEIAGSRMKRTRASLKTTDGVPSAALRTYHKQNLERARVSIDRDSVELRDISSLTMAVDPREIAAAKRAIGRFQDKFTKMFKSKDPSEVYTLAVQFFPQTQPKTLEGEII